MFKTILVPTDGSALADKAIQAALECATLNNAKIIGLSVAEPFRFVQLTENSMLLDPDIYEVNMRELAQQNVQKVIDAASKANVPCETVVRQSVNPYEEIIDVAEKYGCDVIFMASHGRKGLNKLFAGSETQRVLLHSTIPVLILR